MIYFLDQPTYLYRTPMRSRPNQNRISVCLRGSQWPESLTFTLYHTDALRKMLEFIGDEWRDPIPGHLTGRSAYCLISGVWLRRLPPMRERQTTDILQIKLKGVRWPEILTFTIYHGLGTRDRLFSYTEGGWDDE